MLKKVVTHFMLERPVRNKSYAEVGYILEASGENISQHISRVKDSEANRAKLRHIIGIERWVQSRLRVALGDEFTKDEYDGYAPSADTTWQQLKDDFASTRAITIGLTNELIIQNVPTILKIEHNSFGPVSPRGWLRYIDFHSNWESKGLK